MADTKIPNADAGSAPTPELAPTEVARTRTGPRARDLDRGEPLRARSVGRFRIDAELGAGGMGFVFRAYDTVLDRAVALKVLRTDGPTDDGQRRRRIIREARAAAALVHPNAVTVFDVGEADGEVFIAMELLEGEDLRFVLQRGDATLNDKLRWLLEAARALAAAHERGLVHRDVKPENMFVCKGGTLKLLDFGIAKRDDDEGLQPDAEAFNVGPSSMRTTEGRRVGTPRYMAPEQHAGEGTDARTDEYAWGLVAFELLSGAHVSLDVGTRADSGVNTTAAGPGTQRLEVLRTTVPDLPDGTAQTIARALEPRKDHRFATMAPIIASLEAALARASSPRIETATPAPPDGADLAPAPAPVPVPARRSLAVLALGCVAALAAVVAITAVVRARANHGAVKAAAVAACKADATRSLAVSADDRMAVLPSGALVVARDIKKGLFLERDGADGGMEPVDRNPMFAAVGNAYADVGLRGVTWNDQPAILTTLFQAERGAALTLTTDKGDVATRRVFGHVVGVASTELGKGIVAIVTTSEPAPDPRRVDGVQAYMLGTEMVAPTLLENGRGGAPAVATKSGRVAVAYALGGELHFVLLDVALQRIGDVMKVADTDAAPAIAFGGDTATVFWVDDRGGKTRLTSATFTPGDDAFSAPKVAIDEPLAPRRPVTARLPDGSWTVGWVASTGGLSTLRVARVGARGALVGPSDLAKAATVDGLRAASTDRGVEYWWQENDSSVRVARVSCALP